MKPDEINMGENETSEDIPKRRSRVPLILGLALALIGAGGGFFAVYSGLIFASESPKEQTEDGKISAMPDDTPAFVKIDPIIVSLPQGANARLVRFSAQLEVNPDYQREVETLVPRVVDVLNGYLRAVEPSDLEKPSALVILRAQLLRRIQIVTGHDRVRDLLIMEFVLT